MITDPRDTDYYDAYDWYLRQGLPVDEAERLARQAVYSRIAKARKLDTAKTCAWTGAILVVGVLAVAALTLVA